MEVHEKVLDPLTIEKRSHLKKLDSIKAMATSVDFWLYIIIAFILTYFIFGLSYILPLLYVTDLGMTTAESTSAQTWAFIGTFCGCALGGGASDKITKSRRMPVIAFGFILACAFCACVIPGPKMTVGMLTVISFLAMSGAPMASPNTWVVPADLFAPHMITAGTGIALFFSNLGGTVCTAVTGALAQSTGSYYPGLYVMIVVGIFGILAAWILSKKYRLYEKLITAALGLGRERIALVMETICQEAFVRLIMYNFSKLITSCVVIQKTNRKYPCKANFFCCGTGLQAIPFWQCISARC